MQRHFGNNWRLLGLRRSKNRLGPSSGFTIDRHQGSVVDRHFFISSTTFSRETDVPLFSKSGITSAIRWWLTSNWRHWKYNSNLYLVSKDGLNKPWKGLHSLLNIWRIFAVLHLKRLQNHQSSPCPYNSLNKGHVSWFKCGKTHGISSS